MSAENELMFKLNVTNVEIEINSDCNRKCHYCPHSLVKRPSGTMERYIFEKILFELKRIKYDQSFCLNIYNEPLLHFDWLHHVMLAIRQNLPGAKIFFYSNGDLLTKERMDILANSGLSCLFLTCHLGKWDESAATEAINEMCAKLEIAQPQIALRENVDARVNCLYKNVPISIFSCNYEQYGTNRARSLPEDRVAAPPQFNHRVKPCPRPSRIIDISHDGTVYPCCQFMHGAADKKFALGNVYSESLYDIYAKPLAAHFRASFP